MKVKFLLLTQDKVFFFFGNEIKEDFKLFKRIKLLVLSGIIILTLDECLYKQLLAVGKCYVTLLENIKMIKRECSCSFRIHLMPLVFSFL